MNVNLGNLAIDNLRMETANLLRKCKIRVKYLYRLPIHIRQINGACHRESAQSIDDLLSHLNGNMNLRFGG